MRKPVHEHFDAQPRVTLAGRSVTPYALIKETWLSDGSGRLSLGPAAPLRADFRGAEDPGEHEWAPGSDFWPRKGATDVIVEGCVSAPDGTPTPQARASVRVGDVIKRVVAFGRRTLLWSRQGPQFSEPEPFERMGVDLRNAYGGVDLRCDVEIAATIEELARATLDHPGAYPRNPHGTGYVVVPEDPGQEVELPNLEDPSDLLTPERVVVGDPVLWHRQPIPCFLGWSSPAQFPRLHFAGAAPWFPVPLDEVLPEVRRGLLTSDWRQRVASDLAPHPAFFQEASPGLVFAELAPGTPIVLEGFHPTERRQSFSVPRAPEVWMTVGAETEVCAPRLQHLVLHPDERRLEAVWAVTFPRSTPTFLPGIHAQIPVSVRVNGAAPVPFLAPTPVRALLKEAQARGELPAGTLAGPPAGAGREVRPPSARRRDDHAAEDATSIGDVDVLRGRVLLRSPDFRFGHGQIEWARHFSSSSLLASGPLGPRWGHSFQHRLWLESRRLVLRGKAGREFEFPLPDGTGVGIGARLRHSASATVVTRLSSDSWMVTQSDGTILRFVDTSGSGGARLTELEDPEGFRWTLTYDTHGRLAELRLGARPVLRFEHGPDGWLRRVFAPAPEGWALVGRYVFDDEGRLREAFDALGHLTKYRYRGERLTSVVREVGSRRFEYARHRGQDHCCRWFDSDGPTRSIERADEGARLLFTDATERRLSVEFASSWRPRRVIRPEGDVLELEWDETSGALLAYSDAERRASFLYDAGGHLAMVMREDGAEWSLDHDEDGRLIAHTDVDGGRSKWAYDAAGRLTAATDTNGASIVYVRDERGVVRSILAPGEVELVPEVDDESGAIERLRTPDGERSCQRDASGRVVSLVDESGRIWRWRYDASGLPVQETLPDGVERHFTYDGDGRVLGYAVDTRRVKLERDFRGAVVSLATASERVVFRRDAEGRVTALVGTHAEWAFERDAGGRVVEERAPDGSIRYTLRDRDGFVRRVVGPEQRTDVARDAVGRIVELAHSDGGLQRYAWSPGGRLLTAQNADHGVEFERGPDGRVRVERTPMGWVKSTYRDDGARVRIETSLGLVIETERDHRGRAVGVRARAREAELVLRIERDANGNERRRLLPAGVEVLTSRDVLGRPIVRSTLAGGQEAERLELGWAGVDRWVGVRDPARWLRQHHHDAAGRLVGAGQIARVFDAAGNPLRATDGGERFGTLGELLESQGTTFRYDEAGRRVQRESPLGDVLRYRWDALGRLVEVETGPEARVGYAYDGLGRLVRRSLERRVDLGLEQPVWDPVSTTHFIWDGLELIHEITDDHVVTWIWEAGCLQGRLEGGRSEAALSDPSGFPTDLWAEGQLVWRARLDPFGALQLDTSDVWCPFRFAGHWEDAEVGLTFALGRPYDPDVGVYLAPNPLGPAAGLQPYAYLDDPYSTASPLGLGPGYGALHGLLESERLEAELLANTVAALDRSDGAAGPAERWCRSAAAIEAPRPEAALWGSWERLRPSRRRPTPLGERANHLDHLRGRARLRLAAL